jgi:DNA topoisomerase I
VLGEDETGQKISIRTGRFGPYVQRGDATEANPKPDRASLPKGWAPDALTLVRAMDLLNLPRLVGPHPDDGQPIEAAIGRFGPYVKHGPVYANIADVEEVFTIGMNRAVEVLAQKAARGPGGRGAAAGPLRSLGEHPSGGEIQVMPGKYGPYIKWTKVNATLPKEMTPEGVTLDEALALIAEKAGKGGKKAPARKAAAKPAAKKPPTKKAAAKKPAVKKVAKA